MSVRLPSLSLKSDEYGDPLISRRQIYEQRTILPDAIVLAVVIQRISLIHVNVVNAGDTSWVRERAAERKYQPRIVFDRLIHYRDDLIVQVLALAGWEK